MDDKNNDRPAPHREMRHEYRDEERESALWELSKVLHWKMEHLSPEGTDWDEISQDEREFCYQCAASLVRRLDLIGRYYGCSPTGSNNMSGHPEIGKQSDFHK